VSSAVYTHFALTGRLVGSSLLYGVLKFCMTELNHSTMTS
jgi:hypothetical protein